MLRQTKSLLQELEDIGRNRDTQHVVESRGHNIIVSAINLLEMINKHYTPEQSQILERKLINAIKSRDSSKFSKTVRKSK